MSYRVTPIDLTKIRLNEQDTVTSVLQNIAILLATRRGTVPLYRGFGLQQRWLDKPINAAKPMMFVDIKEAVEEYEPRATVVDVTFETDPNVLGRLIPCVEVEINGTES